MENHSILVWIFLKEYSFIEYTTYNPEIPLVMPFPGIEQCDGVKKLLLAGKIPANVQKVKKL